MNSSAEIRRRLRHPIIDIDGHMVEHLPTLAPYVEQEGLSLDHPALQRLLPPGGGTATSWYDQTPEERSRHPDATRPLVGIACPADDRSGHGPLPWVALRAPG